MRTKILKSIILLGAVILFLHSGCKPPKHDMPKNWFAAGDRPRCYKMEADNSIKYGGDYSATIKSIDKKIDGFGTIMQECSVGKFSGKRVRMNGYMKSENVTDWAGFWFRVDVDTASVSFDNMYNGKKDRSTKGTTDWKKYEIVLNVPSNATRLAYGALLGGTGQIWFDNLTFEVVDNSVETTGIERTCDIQNAKVPSGMEKEPVNLGFEK